MNSLSSCRDLTGRTSTGTAADPRPCPRRSTSSPRSAATSARSSCAPPARPTCCRTSGSSSRRPCRSWRSRARRGSCSARTTTSGSPATSASSARALDAVERYGTGLTGSRLLNGTTPLHLELEREIADWMGTEDALVFTTGHQANVGTLGTILAPGDTVIADSADHASILDGCLLSKAKLRPVPPRPPGQARAPARAGRAATAAASSSSSTASSRWRATSPRCRRSPTSPSARRAAHGRRGARRRRARRARRRARPSCSASRTASTCGWARSPSRWPRAAASSPARPTSSTTCASTAARSSSPPRTSRPRWAPRWPPCGSSAPPRAASSWPACWPTRDACATACASSASRSSSTTSATPIVPVLVEDDWKAVLLWRALYDAGVYTNVAIHPAVPPGGALLRTSVMATHDDGDAGPRARALRGGQARVRVRARPAAPHSAIRRTRERSRPIHEKPARSERRVAEMLTTRDRVLRFARARQRGDRVG